MTHPALHFLRRRHQVGETAGRRDLGGRSNEGMVEGKEVKRGVINDGKKE